MITRRTQKDGIHPRSRCSCIAQVAIKPIHTHASACRIAGLELHTDFVSEQEEQACLMSTLHTTLMNNGGGLNVAMLPSWD